LATVGGRVTAGAAEAHAVAPLSLVLPDPHLGGLAFFEFFGVLEFFGVVAHFIS